MIFKLTKYFLILIICSSYFIISKLAFALPDNADWKPQIIEKMYILPPKQLNRVLNNDFRSSSLAITLNNKDIKIKTRHEKIKDLNNSIMTFHGDEKIELQHQLIIEKRDYIKDMHQLLKMKKKELKIKKEFYKQIENKNKIKNIVNKQNQIIIKKREKIIKRTSMLDDKIFDNVLITSQNKSKYSQAYTKNKNAIISLKQAIEKHPMSNFNSESITSKNNINSIKNYIENIETEVAIIELKEEMLNYMVKLVALDAMNLAENISEITDENNQVKNYNDPNDALEFFIN